MKFQSIPFPWFSNSSSSSKGLEFEQNHIISLKKFLTVNFFVMTSFYGIPTQTRIKVTHWHNNIFTVMTFWSLITRKFTAGKVLSDDLRQGRENNRYTEWKVLLRCFI